MRWHPVLLYRKKEAWTKGGGHDMLNDLDQGWNIDSLYPGGTCAWFRTAPLWEVRGAEAALKGWTWYPAPATSIP